ncbi:Uma2 family endonuclease [Streptomyces sp. NBC_01341]|uniref:Uma2 family endonuclease n=1 Tax=Streptomyces sp. NBC_01341 TaxID=2903831 RepID=UPI002E14EC80|nr:Uma2 family endonuclease [Streptomyces sp. NBC_01341]
MTVVDDRIEMADTSDERTLDMMFEWLEPTPEGFKVEIVEGNSFACDVVALSEEASADAKGHWRYQDIEFVAEVISKDTAANDYGPKKATYATAGVPVYLIIDPYTGTWHLHTIPKDAEYRSVLSLDFGTPVDLTGTRVGLALRTDRFPRD